MLDGSGSQSVDCCRHAALKQCPPARLTPLNRPAVAGTSAVLLMLAGGKKMAAKARSAVSVRVAILSAPVMPPGGLAVRLAGAEACEARLATSSAAVVPEKRHVYHCAGEQRGCKGRGMLSGMDSSVAGACGRQRPLRAACGRQRASAATAL